ncbi:MAG TPA: hypothetical protein ENH05_00105 [Rhizobiales bacterium]|nr:hypothetical protein BMS3Bbin10_02902 [bacterium BMS3Bbin10]HDO51123.1 hypothetical protein [Hyphomicrobiales bacterium]
MRKLQTWQGVRDRLEARRAALNEEIAAYPAPIAACDAQFNHLLERRTGLNAQLGRLIEMGEGMDANALAEFAASCPFPGGDTGENQQ